MRNLVPVLALLLSAPAFADESATGLTLPTLSLEQLCELRTNAEIWTELERRDIFSRRELRAIEKERVRVGISEQALLCFMGSPDLIVPLPSYSLADLEAYVYQKEGENEVMVVEVDHGIEASTVASWRHADEASVPDAVYQEAGRQRSSDWPMRNPRPWQPSGNTLSGRAYQGRDSDLY